MTLKERFIGLSKAARRRGDYDNRMEGSCDAKYWAIRQARARVARVARIWLAIL